MPLVIGHGGEDTELGVQVCVDCHDGSHITASVAVVGRRPDRHDGFLREVVLTEIVSLLQSLDSGGGVRDVPCSLRSPADGLGQWF